MKKILAIALLCAMTSAFADSTTSASGSQSASSGGSNSNSGSAATATASGTGGTGGTGTGGVGVNGSICIGTCTDSPTRDLTDTAIANINAQAARDVADRMSSQTIRNTPSVSGPPLTSSNDTCMGSASGSVNAPGFGVSLGKTYTDANCVMLKNSRELWNMGMKAAAMALMCKDPDNREALELTGYVCPQTKRDQEAGKVSAAPQEQYTDPIVRARLGLPPLASAK